MEYYRHTKDNFLYDDEGQQNQRNLFRGVDRNRYAKPKARKWIRDRHFLAKDKKNFKDRKTAEKQQPSTESNRCGSSHDDCDDDSFSSMLVDNRYLLSMDRSKFRDERNVKKEQFTQFSDYDDDYTYNKDHQENFSSNHSAYKNLEIKQNIEWNSDDFFHGKNKNGFPFEETSVQIIKDHTFKLDTYLNYDYTRDRASDQNDMLIENAAFNKQEMDRGFRCKPNLDIKKIQEQPLPSKTVPLWDILPVDASVIIPSVITDNYIKDVHLSNIEAFNGSYSETFVNVSVGEFAGSFGMMNKQGNIMLDAVMKKTIVLTKCVLYPPNSEGPLPTTKKKPLGCRTVFVHGLPPKVTEKIIREVFEHCGEILTLRINKIKGDRCYITFAEEVFAENAMYLSGYEMQIKNKIGYVSQLPYSGRLYVHYARSNDDQYEYKTHLKDNLPKKSMDKEELEAFLSAVYYSQHKAMDLGEKLRKKETFHQAVNILTLWLEKGQCDKKNSSCFYSLIQSTNSYILRLMSKKKQYEEEFITTKQKLKQMTEGILLELKDIYKVFDKACSQKVWSHFTKPQRKNIMLWKKKAEEIIKSHIDVLLNERVEDDMEVSDSDENANVDKTSTILEVNNTLQEENKTLHCELEIARNEILALQSELRFKAQELDSKECCIQSLKDQLKA